MTQQPGEDGDGGGRLDERRRCILTISVSLTICVLIGVAYVYV